MHTIQQATAKHVQEIVALWTKLMNIHKEMDAHYFAETDNTINEYKSSIDWSINHKSNKVFIALMDDKVIGFFKNQGFEKLFHHLELAIRN